MTNKLKIFIVFLIASMFVFSAGLTLAQEADKFALTITPPLVKLNMAPGEVWSSFIRIVNNNPTATSIYASKVDFKSGEDGGVEFIRKKTGGEHYLLTEWLEISDEPMQLSAFEAREIPFTIRVPEKAEAGGHYAAILAGTKPADTDQVEGSGIKISSMLASLIMLNVKGDIIEKGDIRQFTTEKEFNTDPEIVFNMSFENSGNVHIQPQGQIAIYDMFGKEKGRIDINQKSDFGNVLPDSFRKWQFPWQGEKGFFSSGRYRADLVLTFGEQAKQNISQSIKFWIIDVKMTAIIVGSILLFAILLAVLIKLSIRNAVKSAQKQMGAVVAETQKVVRKAPAVRKIQPVNKDETVNLKK